MINSYRNLLLMILLSVSTIAHSETELEVQKVTDNVYAIVGALDQRNPDNYANNATFGFVVTDDGVMLIDSGGSFKGAEQLERAIRTVTDKPVKIVINSGGQDHRWLGNSYFKSKGAHIIASKAASADHRIRTNYHFNRLDQLLGNSLDGTEEVYADQTFEGSLMLNFGGFDFLLIHAGPAHTVGDIFIWMPQQRVMFSGDIVFTERALGPGPAQNVASWLRVFEKMMSYQPKYIIPGHGHVATSKKATNDTYDYLKFLRKEVAKVNDDGGDVQDAIKVDQSRFNYLKVFERISRRNIQSVFNQMEFE